MKKTTLLGAMLAVLIAFGIVLPGTAHALTLTPPRLEVSGDPGTTIVGKMTVINDQNSIETYYSSYANFEAEGESGTPELVPATDDLGTWMTAPTSITLGAGQSEDVNVSIAIPKDAAPGGHFAAVFWGTEPATKSSSAIGIAAKTGMLVLLTVNGDIPESGTVTTFDTLNGVHNFSALPVAFYYLFQNGGGDRVLPTGDIVVKDMLGITAAKVDGNPVDGNVLPRSTRRFDTVWAGNAGATATVPSGFFAAAGYEFRNFAFGRYTAHLDLSFGTKGEMTDSIVHFFVFPWQLLLIILIILVIIFLIIRYMVVHGENWAVGKAEKILEKDEEAKIEERVEEKLKEMSATKTDAVPPADAPKT